jgi:hypothetical protein
MHLHLGLRTTSLLIGYLSGRPGWGLSGVPSPNSIKNRVEKSGFQIYREPAFEDTGEAYARVIDGSMMIGSEKLLLCPGVKAGKDRAGSPRYEDVKVLDISVRPSWNTEAVRSVPDKTREINGHPSTYVISDNDWKPVRAAREQSPVRVPDAGHTLAMFVEREYRKDVEFKSFCRDLADVKFREVMRPVAYLLPPRQRSVARFMNLSASIEWAGKLSRCYPGLTGEERRVFGFIPRHEEIIKEPGTLFKCIDGLSGELKNNGLSHDSIKKCPGKIASARVDAPGKAARVPASCTGYLKEMKKKLPEKDSVWHVSSDIIESMFGYYKSRKSPNLLNGVTTQVPVLPVLTGIDSQTGKSTICFKSALEHVLLRDLHDWKVNNLTENLTIKRHKTLNCA